MIIVKSPSQCEINHIYFTDAIHNAANNSTFSRIMSSNGFATLNGLYMKLPLHKVTVVENSSSDRTHTHLKSIAHYNADYNADIISTIQTFENKILALYKKTFNIANKPHCLHITDTLLSGSLRLGCENHMDANATISGAGANNAGAVDDPDVAVANYSSATRSGAVREREHDTALLFDEKSENIILKISGVWETDKTIGVMFKYITLSVSCIARN
jgi:hypothetical protein